MHCVNTAFQMFHIKFIVILGAALKSSSNRMKIFRHIDTNMVIRRFRHVVEIDNISGISVHHSLLIAPIEPFLKRNASPVFSLVRL